MPTDDIEKRLREKIKDVIPCDIHQEKPLGKDLNDQSKFDLVMTLFCITVTAKNMDDYSRALNRIGTLIKPGGYLLIVDSLKQSFYVAGGVKLPSLPLDESVVKQGLAKANFEIVQCTDIPMSDISQEIQEVTDAHGIHFSFAKKL